MSVLETERLRLREMVAGDVDALLEMLGDAEVMRAWERTFDREGALAWIERQRARYEADGCGYWLAERIGTGEAVGQAGVLFCELDGVRVPGVGYILARRHWGHGYATEAARACLAWAMERLEAPRFVSLVRRSNAASARVAERLGMTITGSVTFAGFAHDVWEIRPTA